MERPGAEAVAKVLEGEPALKRLAEDLRATFGARLVALKGPDVDIGWDKWLRVRDAAEPGTIGFNLAEAREEWARIKAASVKAGDAARRGAAPGKRRVVR